MGITKRVLIRIKKEQEAEQVRARIKVLERCVAKTKAERKLYN